MKIAIVNIGDELLNGRTRDLNAFWLGEFLKSKGIMLSCAVTIQDSPKQMSKVFLQYFNDFDVVITTGGVGPTIDDRTKSRLADAFNKKIVFNLDCKKLVTSHYERYGKSWEETKAHSKDKLPEQNYEYAPEDFTPIHNPVGLAPGFLYQDNDHMIAACPGVPKEFHAMFEQEIFPLISKEFNLSDKCIDQFVIRTRGIPEEKIFYNEDKQLWTKLGQFGSVSSLPYKQGVDIIVTSNANGFPPESIKELSSIVSTSPIKENIWQVGNLSLAEYIVRAATDKKITFGFAESCTGGLLAHLITNISGSSKVFFGSIVSYDNSIKTNSLNVTPELLKNYGAVSEPVALQMAVGARESLHVDITVSTSGIAGPGGGTKEKPVGLVAIGNSTVDESSSELYTFYGNREELKNHFARKALYNLLDLITKY